MSYEQMVASAAKRGKNPRFPYVPIVEHGQRPEGTPHAQRQHTQQIRGKAFATRDEAVAYAQKTIDAWKAEHNRKLADPRMRAYRTQFGLPADLP